MEWVYDNQQKEKRYFRLNGIGLIRLKALVYAQDKLSNKEGIMITAKANKLVVIQSASIC